MFKKIFHPKRKRQEPSRRPNTNKITFDPASAAILNRHFSPLSSRAKSPSDVLDIVGFPLIQNNNEYSSFFSPSSPETPFKATEQVASPSQQRYRLTIRNNMTPSPVPKQQQSILLLETSREDKTLVEREELLKQDTTTSTEIYKLQQKLIKLEEEKDAWDIKLKGYIEREEQMRQLINQLQIQRPNRRNSYKSVSSAHSSAYLTEEEDDQQEEEGEVLIYDECPYNYYTDYYGVAKDYPYPYYNQHHHYDYYYDTRPSRDLHPEYYYYD